MKTIILDKWETIANNILNKKGEISMKTIIQGKVLKTTYELDKELKEIVNDDGETVEVYTGKPNLAIKIEIDKWETIAEFDGKIELNRNFDFNRKKLSPWQYINGIGEINLSEDETVSVIEMVTRVDLGAYVLHIDKVIRELEVNNKEDVEKELEMEIAKFNKAMIESNDKLLSYCKLHNLKPTETDVYELFDLVYPNENPRIVDGKMVNTSKGIGVGDVFRTTTDGMYFTSSTGKTMLYNHYM